MGKRRARNAQPHVIFLVSAILLDFVGYISGLSVTVNTDECIHEYVSYEGDTVSGNFIVVDHQYHWTASHPGLDFTVKSPGDNVVHTAKGSAGEKFAFKAPKAGLYKFCFHNIISSPETVSFYIHVGHIPNEHHHAKDEHFDPVNVKIAELRELLESVTKEQKYLRGLDNRQRRTNENTRKRLIFYTVEEYVMLVAASALQVFYIRKLFSNSVAFDRV